MCVYIYTYIPIYKCIRSLPFKSTLYFKNILYIYIYVSYFSVNYTSIKPIRFLQILPANTLKSLNQYTQSFRS